MTSVQHDSVSNMTGVEAMIKIGIDGGGGFLKVCLTIIMRDEQLSARKTIEKAHQFSSVKNC
jgi:hypothetical protein